ncbi:MAG: hypothetical protein GX768_10820 [Chloroflexi bacterium]|nr:hypothetical protein [Chloroflexota bacterium]
MNQSKKPKMAAKQEQATQNPKVYARDASTDATGYLKLYVKNLPYLSSLPKVDYPVLWSILSHSKSSGKQMTISVALKRQMCQELACRMSRINNALAYLVKTEVLTQDESGLYSTNPEIIG